MLNFLRHFAVALLVVCVSVVTALADDLTVHLGGYCEDYESCNFNPGDHPQFGSPASGWAPINNSPWSYTFETGLPTQWSGNQNYYSATFGPGGTFQMTGPDNLTFTGQITSGTSYDSLFTSREGLDMLFDGYWSNSE